MHPSFIFRPFEIKIFSVIVIVIDIAMYLESLEHFVQLFLDGPRDDEAMNKSGLELSNAMNSADRLVLSCQIHDWLDQDHMIRLNQIDAEIMKFLNYDT